MIKDDTCAHGRRNGTCRLCKDLGRVSSSFFFCQHDKRRKMCSRCSSPLTYDQCQRQARLRMIDFKLTYEEYKLIIMRPCAYCGEPFFPVTVDRINNDGSYSFENCQALCWPCNKLKAAWPEDEFKTHIVKIYRYNREWFI